jgi:hypothetical protein
LFNKVKTIEFDVNFVNYEDPAVLERFIGPEYEKYWKTTYGYDFVTKLPGEVTTTINGTDFRVDNSPMALHCVKSEFRYIFAKFFYIK